MRLADPTMFASLYGKFDLHEWWDPATTEADAYILFHARSAAMGWLAHTRSSACSWGMNDAEVGGAAGLQSSCVAWFQVAPTGPCYGGQMLPAQAFLRCAEDVVQRMGTLDLTAVQILLPAQSLDVQDLGSLRALFQYLIWFADTEPNHRTPIQAIVDSGQSEAIPGVAASMFEEMQGLKQSVFIPDSFSLTHNPESIAPTFTDALWLGPPQHQATFYGTLVEWSLDAIGWLAAFLASMGALHGARTPLLLTVRRSEQSAE